MNLDSYFSRIESEDFKSSTDDGQQSAGTLPVGIFCLLERRQWPISLKLQGYRQTFILYIPALDNLEQCFVVVTAAELQNHEE
ncbi:hypothetical protein [Echinicola rosea]|uniref:hypothetical protein n=1 Tax=Echinicola rosea TaxID=1807691 RepID=UPI0010CA78F6|nr:hypothetical protein [Echinicola rosea]